MTRTWEKWQERLAAHFIGKGSKSQPFILFVDDDELIDIDGEGSRERLFGAVMRELASTSTSSPFSKVSRRVSAWSASSPEPPPVLPLLAVTVLAELPPAIEWDMCKPTGTSRGHCLMYPRQSRGCRMSQFIAEYLGVAVRSGKPLPLIDSRGKPAVRCPFREGECAKAKKGQVPVCSLRDANSSELWIVCEHRLCATSPKNTLLSPYQIEMLELVADTVLPSRGQGVLVIQREARVRREPGRNRSGDSKADFLAIVIDSDTSKPFEGSPRFIIEMQGGGETANTQRMTKLVRKWERRGDQDPDLLLNEAADVNPIETNAWRRQQEQFLIKGSVITRSSGKMAFAMGGRLYDKVMGNLTSPPRPIAVNGGWTLALLGFVETPSGVKTPDSLGLSIDPNRSLFTDYGAFARSLTDQGSYDPDLFQGDFVSLDNTTVTL